MRPAATPFAALVVCALALSLPLSAGDKTAAPPWLPISNEDLALKDNPASPGAQAMILYREDWTDDSKGQTVHSEYRRIKIFTHEGAKYADVEIPYLKGYSKIEQISARTISPSGAVTVFHGEILEKTVVKARGVNFLTKAFTLPDVQAGSIIEYWYQEKADWRGFTLWDLEDELFIRRERFHLQPYTGTFTVEDGSIGSGVDWVANVRNMKQPTFVNGSWELDLESVAASQSEDYMPPRLDRGHWVMFLYGRPNSNSYWSRYGRSRYGAVEEFISKKNLVRQTVEQTVSPGDPPETKLRKLYSRAQQIHHLRRGETEEERKKQHIEENKNVEDVLKRGYGSGWDINVLFLALARAAGFDSALVYLAQRGRYRFHRELPDAEQISSHVVWVKTGGKELYLDPATSLAPYGFLPWDEADAGGVKLVPNGVEFVNTPATQPSEAVIERVASVGLNASGDLEGTLKVSFVGQEAIYMREEALDQDEEHKRERLEKLAAEWLPRGAKLKLDSAQGWEAADQPLIANYSITVPAFAAVTGRRLLFPVSLFGLPRESAFQYSSRKFAIELPYPYQCVDELALKVPPGYEVESVPGEHSETTSFATYGLTSRQEGDTLRERRRFIMSVSSIGLDGYPAVYAFMKKTKGYDQEQAILKHSEHAVLK